MICGVGINDIIGSTNKKHPDYVVYKFWKNMITRSYSNYTHNLQPTYIGTIVCDEWKYISNFKEWFFLNYKEGYQLDKDIIDGTSKIYSPQTCAFVPSLINSCVLSSETSEYPLGVSYHKKHKDMIKERSKPYESLIRKYGRQKTIGTYSTPEEAHKAWQIAKRDYLLELIDKYKNDVIVEVIQGLQRRVDILNDDIKNNRETKSLSKV